jgi:hypothetical protein
VCRHTLLRRIVNQEDDPRGLGVPGGYEGDGRCSVLSYGLKLSTLACGLIC